MMAELDNVPTIDEMSKVIDRQPSGKSPGKDSIPAEVIKSSETVLLEPLHKL